MIYLLRHGLDDERYVGGYSDVGLTSQGIDEIHKISSIIQKYDIKKIYTSDIKRAIQTTEIVNSYLNRQVIIDKNLRELNKGNLNGRLKSTLTIEESNNLNTLDIHEVIGDGEAMIDLYNRVLQLLDSGYFNDKENCLLVTHRGFINMLYFILNNIQLTVDKKRFGVTHGSLHELDIDKKKIRRIM